MRYENLIQLSQLCTQYKVEQSIFFELHDLDIIDIYTMEEVHYIHEDGISTIEKVMRIQKELDINLEGVDAILHLLEKIKDLQTEVKMLKNKLRIYEK